MAKNTKKLSKSRRSALKIEALEQRQLLAGGFTAAQGQEFSDIQHPNGNVYDQVLLKTSAITVTNDPGQITRVSFLDLQGDIVQAEFSGAGELSISLDGFVAAAEATKYNQPGVQYVSGLASFTIQGSDASTYFSLWSVGTATAHGGAAAAIFEGGLTGGNNTVDAARLTIVANPANPSGSTFGGIAAANTIFSADSGVAGITAANVQVQNYVRVGDVNATGTAVPTLVFGTNSQFGALHVAGGDLVSDNGKAINNTGSYAFALNLAAGTTSGGTTIPAATPSDDLIWSGTNPLGQTNKTITLTTGIDNAVGGSGDDTIIGVIGAGDTLTALDKIDGGAGTDTIDLADLASNTAVPGGVVVTNVETINFRSAGGATLDTSSITGVTTLNVTQGTSANITAADDTAITVAGITGAGAVVIDGGSSVTYTNSAGTGTVTVGGTTEAVGPISITGAKNSVAADGEANITISTSAGTITVGANADSEGAISATHTAQGANAITIDSGDTVSVTASKVGTGTVAIGGTTEPASTVTVSSTGDSSTAIGANLTMGAVTVTGGTTVSVTQKAASSTSGAAADTSNWTVTQSAVTVNGGDDTTTVTVTQDSTATAANAVKAAAGTAETNVLTFSALTTGQDTQVGGLTFTASKGLTAAQVAAAFANLSAGATHGSAPAGNGIYSGTLVTTFASGAAADDEVTFTAVAVGNEVDLVVTAGTIDPTVTKTDGTAATAAVTGVMGVVGGKVIVLDNGEDVISSVTLTGYGATSAITSDGLTTLSLANSAQALTVTNTVQTTLGLTVNNLAAGAGVNDAGGKYTTINVTASGANSNVDIDAAAMTKLTVGGDKVLTLAAGSTLTALKTVTVSGSAGLNSGGLATGTITSVDASGTSGAMTVSIDPTKATYLGGSGADALTFTATAPTKTASLGAGNDTLTLAAGTTSSTALLDAGEGTGDTLSMAVADAVTASATATFETMITGFEKLTLTGSLAATGTVDLDNLDGISYVKTGGVNAAQVLTIDNMANAGTVELGGTGTGDTVVAMADAAGSTDSLNVIAATATSGIVQVDDVETINLSATSNTTITVKADTVTTLNVSGSKTVGLTLDAATTELSKIDGSTMTAALTATGNNNVATTILGGSGADVFTANHTSDVLNGGAGADTLKINGEGLVTLTGGSGNDIFDIGTGTAVVNVNSYATITDLAAGDKIKFTAGAADFSAAAITLASTAVFQDFANAAINDTVATDVAWFQFDGNTYIVENLSGGTSFVNGTDRIVKISGLVDLSTAAFSSSDDTLLIV